MFSFFKKKAPIELDKEVIGKLKIELAEVFSKKKLISSQDLKKKAIIHCINRIPLYLSYKKNDAEKIMLHSHTLGDFYTVCAVDLFKSIKNDLYRILKDMGLKPTKSSSYIEIEVGNLKKFSNYEVLNLLK